MRRFKLFAIGACALAAPTAARADLQLREQGAVAYLQSDRLQPGDEETFAEFLSRPRPTPLRIIYLDSRGGNTRTAIAIGQMIRRAGMDTAFNVDRGSRCVSACTTVFLGGVHRYYIGGDHVQDGVATHYGLGFHPSNGGPEGEDRINDYYTNMGVPGAARLRYHLYGRDSVQNTYGERNQQRLFFTSGRRAVSAGVATSTSMPRDRALRGE